MTFYKGYSDHEKEILSSGSDEQAEILKRLRRRERTRTRQQKSKEIRKYGPNGYGINTKAQTLTELEDYKPDKPDVLTKPDQGRRSPRGRRRTRRVAATQSSDEPKTINPTDGYGGPGMWELPS